MRNRKVQRILYQQDFYREERLNRKNEFGNDDLTPRDAVDNMIWNENLSQIRNARRIVASGASLLGGV